MRRFELVQLVVVASAVFVPVVLGVRMRRGWMGATLLVAMVVQLVVEGYRWQSLPLELASVGLAVGDVLWEDRRVRGWPRFRRALGGVPGVALLAVLPIVLPIPEVPRPTGPFPIGTMSFELVDPERAEAYGRPPLDEENAEADEEAEESVPRRIAVQVWYPAVGGTGEEPTPWTANIDAVGPALSREFGFPGFFLGYTRRAMSFARPEATPLSGRLPVVVYSHSWRGFRTAAVDQLESLASHGFLVVAADHTYGSVASVFPDGEVVPLDLEALPPEDEVDEDDYQEAASELVETFSDDLVLILDTLALGSEGAFGSLAEHADLAHIGMFGHSTGGGAAVRTCLIDERCQAVLGLDAWVEPIPDRVVARELDQPSLFMRSGGWQATPNDGRLRGLAERSPAISYWLGIEEAGHYDFALPSRFSPIAGLLGLKGPIPADRLVPILDEYLVGFFTRYLYAVGGAVLEEPSPPEVELEIIP